MTEDFHKHLSCVVDRANVITRRILELERYKKAKVVIEDARVDGFLVGKDDARDLTSLLCIGIDTQIKDLKLEYSQLQIEIPICQ